MRILSCNLGYLLGYEESIGGYIPNGFGAVLGDESTEYRSTHRFIDMIETEQPDVVPLIEIDRGSMRTMTDGQLVHLTRALRARGLEYHGRIYNKYSPESVVAQLPIFRHLGNGVLLKDDLPTTPHYLTTGVKRLVIEVELTTTLTLFIVHLSMTPGTRQDQLTELADLIETTTNRVIIAGDFNLFSGLSELDDLIHQTNLIIHSPGDTVPERPIDNYLIANRALDLFLCSPSITVNDSRVIDVQLSDHRPILLDITP